MRENILTAYPITRSNNDPCAILFCQTVTFYAKNTARSFRKIRKRLSPVFDGSPSICLYNFLLKTMFRTLSHLYCFKRYTATCCNTLSFKLLSGGMLISAKFVLFMMPLHLLHKPFIKAIPI